MALILFTRGLNPRRFIGFAARLPILAGLMLSARFGRADVYIGIARVPAIDVSSYLGKNVPLDLILPGTLIPMKMPDGIADQVPNEGKDTGSVSIIFKEGKAAVSFAEIERVPDPRFENESALAYKKVVPGRGEQHCRLIIEDVPRTMDFKDRFKKMAFVVTKFVPLALESKKRGLVTVHIDGFLTNFMDLEVNLGARFICENGSGTGMEKSLTVDSLRDALGDHLLNASAMFGGRGNEDEKGNENIGEGDNHRPGFQNIPPRGLDRQFQRPSERMIEL